MDLARDSAHEVERSAAPLTAFLVGVAVGRGDSLGGAAAKVTAALALTRGAASKAAAKDGTSRPVTEKPLDAVGRRATAVGAMERGWLCCVALAVLFVNLGEWQLPVGCRSARRETRPAGPGASRRQQVFTRVILTSGQA